MKPFRIIIITLFFITLICDMTAATPDYIRNVWKADTELYPLYDNPIVTRTVKSLDSKDNCKRAISEFQCRYKTSWTNLLIENDLPKEFAYIPLAMNGLSVSFSTTHNAGLWGLTLPAARHYGLKVDDGYDERYAPDKSTTAAVRYLYDLYSIYNQDFWLTLLAFANSPAQLNDAIVLSGNDSCTVWDLYRQKHLSNTEIIPEMIAYIALSDKNDYKYTENINEPSLLKITLADQVKTNHLCESIAIDEERLLGYNPAIRPSAKYIKPTYELFLPDTLANKFNACADALYIAARAERDSIAEAERLAAELLAKQREIENQAIIYQVKSGDTLGHIAMRNKVSVSQLKKWNNLRSDMLQIGQTLKIHRNN